MLLLGQERWGLRNDLSGKLKNGSWPIVEHLMYFLLKKNLPNIKIDTDGIIMEQCDENRIVLQNSSCVYNRPKRALSKETGSFHSGCLPMLLRTSDSFMHLLLHFIKHDIYSSLSISLFLCLSICLLSILYLPGYLQKKCCFNKR